MRCLGGGEFMLRRLNPEYGWEDVPLPKDVEIASRMHLSQEQVRELLPLLQHFAETGEIPESEPEGEP